MIDRRTYWRRWCPFCNSPKIDRVALITEAHVSRLNERYRAEEYQEFTHTEHIRCANCERVFLALKIRWACDRKAMRRDYITLGKLLVAKGGG